MEMAKNFRKCLSCYHVKNLLIIFFVVVVGVKTDLEGRGVVGELASVIKLVTGVVLFLYIFFYR